MASSKDEQAEKAKQMPNLGQNKKIKNNPPGSKNKYLTTLAIIVALVALGTAGYTLFANHQLHNQLISANTRLSAQLKQLEQKQDDTQNQINEKTTGTEEAQTKLNSKFANLKNQVQNALSQRLYQNQDWLLLKARYYLELAQINAHWSTNADSTVALMQEADQLLKQFNEPKMFEIRQALAKDIAQIQAKPPVDISGLLSQLDAAQDSINDLNIPLSTNDENSAENNTASNQSSSWNSRLHNSMNLIGKLVVIRRHEHNIKPLLSPLLEAILKENLRLNLQEAQWAVLNNNPYVFQLVLKQAIKNLQTHFNANMPNTAALIKKLTELQQIKFTQIKPLVNSALPLLNELIDSKKARVHQSLNSESGGNQ